MTMAPSGAMTSVEAIIVDDAGTIVAQRTLTDRSARSCTPLARAVGAWASLVLDAELARAKDDDGPGSSSYSASSLAAPSDSGPIVRLAGPAVRNDTIDALGRDALASAPRPTIEIGTMMYLRNGLTPTGGFAGVSPFLTVEVTSGWVLRPSLAFGRSTSAIPVGGGRPSTKEAPDTTPDMSHIGARADFCRRIPGNYIERRGIEADLCAGVEGGIIMSDTPLAGDRTVGRLGMGPAVNLRGELALGLALEIRGLAGANIVDSSVYQEGPPPLVFAAAELGLSVRLP